MRYKGTFTMLPVPAWGHERGGIRNKHDTAMAAIASSNFTALAVIATSRLPLAGPRD